MPAMGSAAKSMELGLHLGVGEPEQLLEQLWGGPCTPLQLCDMSVTGSRLREEELRENLKQEETRLEQMQAHMLNNQKRLIEFENIVDNLFLRVQGIVIPGQVHQGTRGAGPRRQGCTGTPGTATTATRALLSPPRWFCLP